MFWQHIRTKRGGVELSVVFVLLGLASLGEVVTGNHGDLGRTHAAGLVPLSMDTALAGEQPALQAADRSAQPAGEPEGYSPAPHPAAPDGDGGLILGDMDCDELLSRADVKAFVLAALDPAAWCNRYGRSHGALLARGDFNGDGRIDEQDIRPFCKAIRPHLAGRRLAGGGDGWMDNVCTTPEVDLWLDSDNDNGTDCPGLNPDLNYPQAQPPFEEAHAKHIPVNADDDNENLTPDSFEDGEVIGECGELTPLILKLPAMHSHCDPTTSPLVSWNGCLEAPQDGALPRFRFWSNYSLEGTSPAFRIWTKPTRGALSTAIDVGEATACGQAPITGQWVGCGQLAEMGAMFGYIGDMNCDGTVDNEDLDPFVLAITDAGAYAQQHPNCDLMRADITGDCLVDFEDIDPFLALIAPGAGATYYVHLWIEGLHATGGAYTLNVDVEACACEGYVGHGCALDSVLIEIGACDEAQYRNPLNHEGLGLPLLVGTGVPLAVCGDPNCPICAEGALPSRCQNLRHYGETIDSPGYFDGGAITGYPLNLALAAGPAPGDYPPRDLTPTLSSLPLVSSAVSAGGFGRFLERPTLQKEVDLITGVTLHQAVDFELPFGGAVFRHVRTFSETLTSMTYPRPGAFFAVGDGGASSNAASDLAWDWNGMFWMMSENPILLIDASYPGILHGWEDDAQICYFIPDAHHAVPFLKQGPGQYVCAVDWIDARLTTSAVEPDRYWVHLYNGTVTYEFQAVYEDHWAYVDDAQVRHTHDPHPSGPGMPYYGLLQQVTDACGNKMACEYVAAQWQPTTLTSASGGCRICAQECNAKGQLKTVKLYAAGESHPAWTLVYTHRTFGDVDWHESSQPQMTYAVREAGDRSYFVPRALHAIHVYEGNIDVADEDVTLHYDRFYSQSNAVTSFDEYESITGEPPGLSSWVQRVQYIYNEMGFAFYNGLAETTQYSKAWQAGTVSQYGNHDVLYPGLQLLKAQLTRRDAEQAQDTVTFYRYEVDEDEKDYGSMPNSRYYGLKAVFSDDTVTRITAIMRGVEPEWTVNDFMTLPDSYEIEEDRPLLSYADLGFRSPNVEVTPGTPFYMQWAELQEQIGYEAAHTYVMPQGKWLFLDQRDGSRLYRITRLETCADFPEQNPTLPGVGSEFWHRPALHHWPYRVPVCNRLGYAEKHPFLAPTGEEELAYVTQNWLQPYYTTIIDEIPVAAAWHDIRWYDTEPQPISRRVVEMNIAGIILRDRTWEGDELVARTGFGEHRIYEIAEIDSGEPDRKRVLLKELRTKGWDTVDPSVQDSQGLIYVYDYDAQRSYELASVGVKSGTGGDLCLLSTFVRHQQRHDLVIAETQYLDPLGNQCAQILTDYVLGDPPPGVMTRPIHAKEVRGPSVAGPGGIELQTVERWAYDLQGKLTHHAIGSTSGNQDVELYCNTTFYDEDNRERLRVIDDPDSGEVWGWSFQRVGGPGTATALNYRRTSEYYDLWGLKHVVEYEGKPEERHTCYRYEMSRFAERPWAVEQWIFRNMAPDPDPRVAGYWALQPIEYNVFESGRLIEQRLLEMPAGLIDPLALNTGEFLSEFDPTGVSPPIATIKLVEPQYDANGKLIEMKVEGQGAGQLTAKLQHHATGQIERQEGPDGTITRNVYNRKGQLHCIYQGTQDESPQWKDLLGDPCTEADDNLVLLEAREYGVEATDADELVKVKHYSSKPTEQYPWTCAEAWFGGPLIWQARPEWQFPEPDWITNYHYDWRMREVAVERKAGEQVLGTTLTWLDHQDRVRFVAEYGPGSDLPTTVHPCFALPGQDVPESASVILNDGAPISLTENKYNARGQVEETRRYDVSDETGASYSATFTYYDYGGRPIEVHTSGAPIQRYAYDAKGRQIESSSWAATSPETDLSSVVTEYDANDRALETTRIEDPAGEAIPSYSHSWYDESGRLLATANYGTNSAAGYVKTGAIPQRGDDPPQSVTALDALVTLYAYDSAGRQNHVAHPDGTVTHTEYDNLGRLLLTTENAEDRDGDGAIRHTAYKYDDAGRLAMIAAVAPEHNGGVTEWSDINWLAAQDPTIQITTLEYDAAVMPRVSPGPTFNGQLTFAWEEDSRNNGLVSLVTYPDNTTIHFTYYNDGAVASRADSRGTKVLYDYDELGRLITTYIDDRAYFDQNEDGTEPIWAPVSRVRMIAYDYDNDGRLQTTDAYTFIGAAALPLAANHYDYDDHGNLECEIQNHVFRNEDPWLRNFACNKDVRYGWEFKNHPAPLGGRTWRPSALLYPQRKNQTALGLTFDYTSAVDDALDRISRISDGPHGPLAAYDYLGVSRRTGLSLGGGLVNQTFAPAGPNGGLPGLDRYGRIADLHYEDGSTPTETLHRYQHDYDSAGNRIYALVTQYPTIVPDDPVPLVVEHINDRSYAYGYDALQQLNSADLGQLTIPEPSGVPYIAHSSAVALERQQDWRLDTLGNWVGHAPAAGTTRHDFFYGSGTPGATLDTTHTVNLANALDAVTADVGSGPITQEYIHDKAGNLVWDGVLFYQYDAFGRLCRVIQAPDLLPADFDDAGRLIESDPPPPLGDPIVDYFYDGFGRLIAKDHRVSATCGAGDSLTCVVQEDYWYDGARRIFESEYYEPNTAMYLVLTLDPLEVYREREYVYGPDYVDEFVCYLDEGDPAQPIYMLQDANYNVVALVDGYGESLTFGHVIAQQQFTPYGEIAVADNPVDTSQGAQGPGPITNRVGHQGLFFERFYTEFESKVLDPALLDPSQLPPPAPGRPTAAGFYVARNRAYDPSLGRYLSRDPNETALVLLSSATFNGQTAAGWISQVEMHGHYSGGMNLYALHAATPIGRANPLGLAWHHLYPCYLGGAEDGPGIKLEHKAHMDTFHNRLRELLGGGNWEKQRAQWALLDKDGGALRKKYLTIAAEEAGVDTSSPQFKAVLEESYTRAQKTHGTQVTRKTIPKALQREVPMLSTRAAGLPSRKIPGLNASKAIGVGIMMAGAVSEAAVVFNAMDFENVYFRSLVGATVNARSSGGLSLWDEAFGFMDFHGLTEDPFSAAWAWLAWSGGL